MKARWFICWKGFVYEFNLRKSCHFMYEIYSLKCVSIHVGIWGYNFGNATSLIRIEPVKTQLQFPKLYWCFCCSLNLKIQISGPYPVWRCDGNTSGSTLCCSEKWTLESSGNQFAVYIGFTSRRCFLNVYSSTLSNLIFFQTASWYKMAIPGKELLMIWHASNMKAKYIKLVPPL